jgi:hypothetical protein
VTEEERHRNREECLRQASMLLDGSEASIEAIENAWLDIHLAEGDRQLFRSPTSDERENAARIVLQIDKVLRDWKPFAYAFGSDMFSLLTSAPTDELRVFRERAAAFADTPAKRTGNVDASRKRQAADLALRLFEGYPSSTPVLDKQRAYLAALLIGEPEADMQTYITEAKKRSRK